VKSRQNTRGAGAVGVHRGKVQVKCNVSSTKKIPTPTFVPSTDLLDTPPLISPLSLT
jgi:hypothetical protein